MDMARSEHPKPPTPSALSAVVDHVQTWSCARWFVLVCAAGMLSLSFAQRAPCLQTVRAANGQRELNWRNDRQYDDYCYSDVVALYSADDINQPDGFPYKTSWVVGTGAARQVHYVEYPVLTGLFMWATAKIAAGEVHLTRGRFPALLPVTLYFCSVAVFLAVAWLCVVNAIIRLSRDRRRQALLVALSPLLIAQIYTNFDALSVALATGGLLAWSRRRPILTGVLIGLGAATKFYPVLLLVPLVALCLRAGTLRPGMKAVGGAVASWAIVNAPFALLYPSGWSYFFRFSATRSPGFESLFTIVPYFTGVGLDQHLATNQAPSAVNTVSGGLLIVACLAICWVALSAPRRPRLAPLCFLVVISFLLTSKVYSPQFSLWLVPLAVLSLPRWRLLVPWMIIDALVWVPWMLMQRGIINEGTLSIVILVRDAMLVALCTVIVRDIYHPEQDPVRRAGDDDPCGGVVEGAEDHLRWRRWRKPSPGAHAADLLHPGRGQIDAPPSPDC